MLSSDEALHDETANPLANTTTITNNNNNNNIDINDNNVIINSSSENSEKNAPSSSIPAIKRGSNLPDPDYLKKVRYSIAVEGWACVIPIFIAACISSTVTSIIKLVPNYAGRLICYIAYALISYLFAKFLVLQAASSNPSQSIRSGSNRPSSSSTRYSSQNKRSTNPNIPHTKDVHSPDNNRKSTKRNTNLAAYQSAYMNWLGSSLAFSIIVAVDNAAFAWKDLFIFVLFDSLYSESGNIIGYSFLEFILFSSVVIGAMIYGQLLFFSHVSNCSSEVFKSLLLVDIDIFALPLAACFFIIVVAGTGVEKANLYLFTHDFVFPTQGYPNSSPGFILLLTFILIVVVAVYRLIIVVVLNTNNDEFHSTDYLFVNYLIVSARFEDLRQTNLSTLSGKNSLVDGMKVSKILSLESGIEDGSRQRVDDEVNANSLVLNNSRQSFSSYSTKPPSSPVSSRLTTGENDRSPSVAISMNDSELYDWTDDILDNPAWFLKTQICIKVLKNILGSAFFGYSIALGLISFIVNCISHCYVCHGSNIGDKWIQILALAMTTLFWFILFTVFRKYTDLCKPLVLLNARSSVASVGNAKGDDVRSSSGSVSSAPEVSMFSYSVKVIKSSIRLLVGVFFQQFLFYFYFVIAESKKTNSKYDEEVVALVLQIITTTLVIIFGLIAFNYIYGSLRLLQRSIPLSEYNK